jgi:hypothetical protein
MATQALRELLTKSAGTKQAVGLGWLRGLFQGGAEKLGPEASTWAHEAGLVVPKGPGFAKDFTRSANSAAREWAARQAAKPGDAAQWMLHNPGKTIAGGGTLATGLGLGVTTYLGHAAHQTPGTENPTQRDPNNPNSASGGANWLLPAAGAASLMGGAYLLSKDDKEQE